ncbi:CCR4-NOT regulatory complex component [Hypoxylon texense]
MLPGQPATTSGHRGGSRRSQVTLIRDHQACIPLTRILGDGDIVVLLTPVVQPVHPDGGNSNDPFEPLGRALAARHPWIRHVPYTSRNKITSTHAGFIKRAKIVVFVISGPPSAGQPSQVEIGLMARMVGEERPQIIVACQNVHDLGLMEANFPTIVQLPGYLPSDLQAAAAVLFGEATATATTTGLDVQSLMIEPKFWPPENWDGRDVSPIHELWNQCLPDHFHLEKFPLRTLLQRDGYAMHFIVKLPDTHEVVGFCATYTTFVDREGERLIGSLALIIVKPAYRHRGIGLSLYEHALKQLKRTRGVDRIQLGSTFPRLLSGIPTGSSCESWFQRRGWQMDGQGPGRGQDICDWLLKIDDWPSGGLSASSGLTFRQGTFDDFNLIADFVEKESARKDYTGWYDQYMNLAHDGRISDIILGMERSEIVASALIYTPHEVSSLARDLPWARTIGSDVGGVACICIADDNPAMTTSKDTVMIRLLDACVTVLREQGMTRVFLDAVRGGYEGFQSMGFQKWAIYRDLWQKV